MAPTTTMIPFPTSPGVQPLPAPSVHKRAERLAEAEVTNGQRALHGRVKQQKDCKLLMGSRLFLGGFVFAKPFRPQTHVCAAPVQQQSRVV